MGAARAPEVGTTVRGGFQQVVVLRRRAVDGVLARKKGLGSPEERPLD